MTLSFASFHSFATTVATLFADTLVRANSRSRVLFSSYKNAKRIKYKAKGGSFIAQEMSNTRHFYSSENSQTFLPVIYPSASSGISVFVHQIMLMDYNSHPMVPVKQNGFFHIPGKSRIVYQ